MNQRVPVAPDASHCSTCMLGHVCLPIGMAPPDIARLDQLVKERIRIGKGQYLYRLGDAQDAIYGIRVGSLKTLVEDAGGQVQITGFHLPGEIVGLDGMLESRHVSSAQALEDTEVCVIRLSEVDDIARQLPSLQPQVRRLMSREISRAHTMLATLGGMRAEQRLAAFLVNLSQRLSVLGYSSVEFVMRMSREEIGNYLGLTLETVSRLFSRLGRDGLIRIHQREVRILDMESLRQLAGPDC